MTMFENKLEFPIHHIYKNMVFNKRNEVWAFYRLSEEHIPLNNEVEYDRYVQRTAEFLAQNEYDYHIMIIPRRFNFQNFTDVIKKDFVEGEFEDIGKKYFDRAGAILENEVHLYHYNIYLAVNLNKMDNVVTTDVQDFLSKLFKRLKDDISKVINRRDHLEDDYKYFEELELRFREMASYHKKIIPIPKTEVEKIVYYHFHRTDDDLESDINDYNLTEGVIQNRYGYMTVTHADYTEYLAFLPISEMPAAIENNSYILDILENVDFPVEIQIKYHFKDNDVNVRQVRKLRKRFRHFDTELLSTESADDDPIVERAFPRMSGLLQDVKDASRDILYMTFTLVIADRDKEVLEEKYRALSNMFKNTQFKMVRPLVDQLTLFGQSLPSSMTVYDFFEQVVDETYLAQSSFDLNNRIGNKFGMVLGKVITGKKISNVEQARAINNNVVVFNPTLTKRAIGGATHTNGNIIITGPPGSGKSLHVKNLFTWTTFFGSKVLYIDPKNELQRYYERALEKYHHVPEFKNLYERINFVHLSEEKRYKGALDPLVFLEGDNAIQTADMILTTLAKSAGSRNDEAIINQAVVDEVSHEENPTLTGALNKIKEKDETLGAVIGKYNYGLGRMLFGDEYSRGLDFESQINVLGLQGLKMPTTDNFNDEERIGLCLMMSISKYVHTFSVNPNEDAMIIFDEAWILKRSDRGQDLIDEMLRTGRSLRTDIVLVTQAFDDFNVDTTKEQIGVKFAFRPKSDDTIKPILRFFDLQDNEKNIEIVRNLGTGMCLFQDHMGRNQAIAIDVLFDEWFEAFQTTDRADKAIYYEEQLI